MKAQKENWERPALIAAWIFCLLFWIFLSSCMLPKKSSCPTNDQNYFRKYQSANDMTKVKYRLVSSFK